MRDTTDNQRYARVQENFMELPVVDFFFEIERNPEPSCPADLYFITQVEWRLAPEDETWPCPTLVRGNVIDSWTSDDPGRDVESAREAQAYSLEERLEMEFEREMRDR